MVHEYPEPSAYKPGDPITISLDEDVLLSPYDVFPGGHNGELEPIIGIHEGCEDGVMRLKEVAGKYHVMNCRGCLLRVTFPITVSTYAELHAYMSQHLKQLPYCDPLMRVGQ